MARLDSLDTIKAHVLAEFGAKTIKTGSLEFFGCYMYNKVMIMLINNNAAAESVLMISKFDQSES
jgi:hypothetical protein